MELSATTITTLKSFANDSWKIESYDCLLQNVFNSFKMNKNSDLVVECNTIDLGKFKFLSVFILIIKT
jgi:hypothetical protein